jgi:hypothetical protein
LIHTLLDQVKALRGPKLYAAEITFRLVLAFMSPLLPAVFSVDLNHYFAMSMSVDAHSLPYRDVVWEFPPLTTFMVPLVMITAHNRTAFHIAFVFIMVACEWASMHRLRTVDERNYWPITAFWTAVVVPFGMLVWNRLDFLSVLFATLALTCMIRGKPLVHWALLGFLAKLWPALFAVELLARRRFREFALCAAGVCLLTASWWFYSPTGFREFLKFRKGVGFHIESVPGSLLFYSGRHFHLTYGAAVVSDHGLRWLQAVMFYGTIVGTLVLTVRAFRHRSHDGVVLIAACVALSLVFSRLISTQYVVWLAPFIALRLRTHARIAACYAVIVYASIVVLCVYWHYSNSNGVAWASLDVLLIFRNVFLVALTLLLMQANFQESVPSIGQEQTFENMRE